MNQGWDIRKEEPLVSVCVVTYNHSPYIRDCLDGALNQNTDFPYEICVGEDESSDGTRAICKEYAEKHPEKIRIFLRSREDVIYSHGYPTGRFNFLQTIKACRGKYIALCEGDDYWHDPEKLKKQVEFMEANPDYSMCNSDYDYLNEISGYFIKHHWRATRHRHDAEEDITPLLLSEQYIVRTPTALVRSEYLTSILEEHAEDFDERYRLADSQMWFHLSRKGKVKYFDESMATYRRVPNSVTAMDNLGNRYSFIKNVYWHKRSFAERAGYNGVLPLIDRNYLNQLASLAVLVGDQKEAMYYAARLTEQDCWRRGTGLLRFAARYGGLYAFLYKSMRGLFFWCEKRTGNLSGHLRVWISALKK